ncbi:MAG: hypothetical protein ABIN79_00285 [Marmoricola sp.]
MKKILAALAIIASMLVVPVMAASPASARCAPPGDSTIYTFSKKSFNYYPTNIRSDWAIFRKGGTITYSKTKTMEVNASMTATVSAEAGVIFAKASTSLGLTVGGSLSDSEQWSYSANVPADRRHKYRLHAYHYTANFSVMKKRFNGAPSVCNYVNSWKSRQRVTHAPAKASNNVWRLDKAAA